MERTGRGYLIVANNSDTVDYVDCALACARSIKLHTPNAKIALLADREYDFDVFDYSIKFPFAIDSRNPYAVDWQAWYATPFFETIKIEADMIIPHSIEHWWEMLRKKEIVLTIGARNYQNQPATSRAYRKIFDANDLPDVYNAITYWRDSDLARDFAALIKYMFIRWDLIQPQIKMGLEDPGTTDVIYAIAAKILGIEKVTLPNTSYPSLIHMRGRFNWLQGEDWTKELVWELDGSNIRINTIDQEYPFHYIVKEFSKELNKHYDKLL